MSRIVAVALMLVVAPAHSLAFSDPQLFAAPADQGGGGGRQFTGSPADGFSCSVCHQGGDVPEVALEGLPDRFAPGGRYQVTVRWTDPSVSHALQLELMTDDGRPLEVELPADDELSPDARCEARPDGTPAVYLTEAGARRVLGVLDCGAASMTFAFTAPDDGRVVVAAGVVRSDSSATADGDGVLEIRREIARTGAEHGGDCSAAGSGASFQAAWLCLIVTCMTRRRRRSRRRRGIGSAEVDAHAAGRLEHVDVVEPREGQVAEPADRRAQPGHEDDPEGGDLPLVHVGDAELLPVEGGQFAVTRDVAVGRVQVDVLPSIEVGLPLGVVAVAQGGGPLTAEEPCDVGLGSEGAHPPRVDVEARLQAQGQGITEGVPSAQVQRVSPATVRHLLAHAEQRASSAGGLIADRDPAVRAGLVAIQPGGLPREVGERGWPEHLCPRGAGTRAAERRAEPRIARPAHLVEPAKGVERQSGGPLAEIQGGASGRSVRPVVRLGRVAVAARHRELVARVAGSGVDLVAPLADGARGGGDHVDGRAAPRVDAITGLQPDRLLHLGSHADAGRDDGRRVAVGSHVDHRGGLGGPDRRARAPGDERGEQRESDTRSPALTTGLGLLLAWVLAGCYQPRLPDEADRDAAPLPVDLFQNDAGVDAGACADDPSPLTALHVSVRTTALGGRWRPRNVGAIWITDGSGAFVKTLELWGKTRARWLVDFQTASAGDVTDAITGATLSSHETHDASWDLTDGSGCEVVDGEYQLGLELTDRDAAGAVRFIPFLKETSMTVMPEDSETFHDIVLSLE